jgi:VWFA-related protein
MSPLVRSPDGIIKEIPMHRTARLAGLAFLGVVVALQAPPARLSAGPQATPQQPPQPQVPTFRAGVNLVRVDVIVSGRDGKPVIDLTEADFEIAEDGKPQKIETLKLVRIDGVPQPGDAAPREIRSLSDEETEAAREDARLYAVFLDDYHVRRASAMSVRPVLAAFVQKQLAPADLCGVMYPVTPVSALVLTRDQESLLSAIRRFEGRKYDYQPRNSFEERYVMYPAAVVERIRNQVTLSALRSLVIRMGSLREGRKAVILVSEGFSNVLPAQLNDPSAIMPGMVNPAPGAPVTATAPDPVGDRASFLANLDLTNDLRLVYDAANRNNTAIYTLDPRGLAAGEFGISEGVGAQADHQYLQTTLDTLRALASETDGRAIINRNDLEVGLRQVVQDSSAYYLLGYNSTNTAADGKFHEIKVRARRPGVQVRARRGYWALTKEEAAKAAVPPSSAVPPAVTKALGSMAEPWRGRYVRSWIGMAKGENGRTRVTFVWEPQPPVPGAERSAPLGVIITATAGSRSFFQGAVTSAGATVPGASAVVTFDADPGAMHIRISVMSAGADTLDAEAHDVTVPDFTMPRVALGTPAVFRAGNAREFQALAVSPSPAPTAGRDFRRTERLLVRFDAYAPGSEVPIVTARVLSRVGAGLADLEVRAPQPTGAFYQIDLPLAGFAPGEYLIEVKARGAGGDATELVPLRITG